MARFYVLALEPTLFSDTALVREFGRIGCRGRRLLELHPSPELAAEARWVWAKRKGSRGYVVKSATASAGSGGTLAPVDPLLP